MKSLNPSRNGLFLIEFVIVLLFFSVISVIVFQLFVKGSGISEQAYNMNIAVVRAQSITEQVLASNGEDEALSGQFIKTQDGYALYYDKDWNTSVADGSVFSAQIDVERQDAMLVSEVTLKKGGQPLYSVHSEQYMGLD